MKKTIEKVLRVQPRNRNMGRPRKYLPEFASVAAGMSFVGALDQEIAEFLGVSERTFKNWRASKSEFAAALRKGKYASAEVALALYNRAVGYEYTETTETESVDNKGETFSSTRVSKKTMAPSVEAQKFWLMNRDPERWKEAKEKGLENPDDLVRMLHAGRARIAHNEGEKPC